MASKEKGIGGPIMFLFGGISAQVAALFTNPIDVVKIRLQLQGEQALKSASGSNAVGLVGMFSRVMKQEGILALWKGIVPSLLREISYSSFRLGAYEPIRNMLLTDQEARSGSSALWKKFAAGATTGAIGSGLGSSALLLT
jgi:hypothetical protein